jgi:hypothetical protein
VVPLSGRFEHGNWFYSSLVATVEGDLIVTLNSVYQIVDPMKYATISWSSLPLLQHEVSPNIIDFLMERGL